MTSECQVASQMATLTTDAVPIPLPEVQNAHRDAVSTNDSTHNQLEESDSRDSEDSEGLQEEELVRREDNQETENVKPLQNDEIASPEELISPKVSDDKVNETLGTPMVNKVREKKKKSADDKRIMKSKNAELLGPGPSVGYNIKNVKGLHIGPNITINVAPKQEKSPQMSTRRRPKEIEEMLHSTVPVTDEDLQAVSPHVGHGWKLVGRRLEFSEGELEQLETDYHLDRMNEIIYQMLLAWKRKKTDKATRGVLCSALCSAEEYDAAKKLVRRKSKAEK